MHVRPVQLVVVLPGALPAVWCAASSQCVPSCVAC
jgi:hypothetical protein